MKDTVFPSILNVAIFQEDTVLYCGCGWIGEPNIGYVGQCPECGKCSNIRFIQGKYINREEVKKELNEHNQKSVGRVASK